MWTETPVPTVCDHFLSFLSSIAAHAQISTFKDSTYKQMHMLELRYSGRRMYAQLLSATCALVAFIFELLTRNSTAIRCEELLS